MIANFIVKHTEDNSNLWAVLDPELVSHECLQTGCKFTVEYVRRPALNVESIQRVFEEKI